MKKLILILYLGLWSVITQAQENTISNLSLSDAIQVALDNNYDILIEDLKIEDATQQNTMGQAGRYPDVSFSVTSNNNYVYNEPSNPFALSGVNISDNVSGRLNANWVIFNGFRVNITKSRLNQLQAQSQIQASVVIENTIEQVILAYYGVILEEERHEVLNKVMLLSKDRVDRARMKQNLGSSTTFELSREESTFFTDSTNLVNQSVAVRNAYKNLNVLLAEEDIEKTYNLTDRLTFELKKYLFETLYQEMEESNTLLKQQYIARELSANNVRTQKLLKQPRLSLDVGVNGTASWFTADFPIDNEGNVQRQTNGGYNYGPYANVTLSVPIYSGNRNNHAIQSAKLSFEQQNINIDKTRLDLKNQLSQSLDRYHSDLEVVNLSTKSKNAAELNLNLSQDQLKNGTITSFDFRQVQITYLNAALNELNSMYSLIQSHTSLLKMTGQIVD